MIKVVLVAACATAFSLASLTDVSAENRAPGTKTSAHQRSKDRSSDRFRTTTSPSSSPTVRSRDSGRSAASSCAEYGAGFVRLEGSNTCMRIGGSISVGTSGGSGSQFRHTR